MRSVLAYAPRPGPLGSARPWVAAVYLTPLAAVAFASPNPLVLASCGLAALLVAAASRALGAVLGALRFGGYLAVTIVAVNGLVAQRGETILLRGGELPVLGRVDVSLEALAEGGVLALRILVALAVFGLWSACIDPDRVLRALRPWAARSALTATLIARLVPLAAADARRLSEAARLRGPGAAPVGRAAIARRLLAGSLDRSVDVAATLELRGYGIERRAPRSRRRLDRGEAGLVAAAVAVAALGVLAAVAGFGGFEAYPRIMVDLGAGTAAVALALPALALLPFLASRSGARSRPTHPEAARG